MPLVGFTDRYGQEVPFNRLDAAYSPDRWGMPLPFLKALTRQKRSYADISVTELVGPPQIRLLKARHEYAADPADLVWASFGSGLHQFLELRAEAGAIAEERLVAEFDVPLPNGLIRHIRLGGTADHYDSEHATLTNYKTSTVYKAKQLHDKGPSAYADWVAAENCYAFLFRRYGFAVEKVQICLLLKDWSMRDRDQAQDRYYCTKCDRNHVRTSGPGKEHAAFENQTRAEWYPPTQIHLCELPLWSQPDAESYINGRLVAHLTAELERDDQLPSCTVEETWNGRRCEHWCEVAGLCWQHRRAGLEQKST
jgi:hypothetical protein